MSSILRSMAEDSIAVFIVCALTANGSHTPSSFMSDSRPVCPLIPQVQSPALPSACFALSLVKVRITLAPQFCVKVRGITSRASPTARYGHCSMPSSESAFSARQRETAISQAPPPGQSLGSSITFLATPIASMRFLSTSFNTSLEAPRRITEQAFGSSQSTTKEKYSSPSFSTLNRPAFVPMSLSLSSSTRCTIVAPQARAILLLSVLRIRRIAEIPALER
mmetsp:Transcript_22306/g.26832  ORF Transcript_22306/g.26832 Transcript_22306/m.26832 type:complete len:222 (+) Transcript_22306:452-1117(+)